MLDRPPLEEEDQWRHAGSVNSNFFDVKDLRSIAQQIEEGRYSYKQSLKQIKIKKCKCNTMIPSMYVWLGLNSYCQRPARWEYTGISTTIYI